MRSRRLARWCLEALGLVLRSDFHGQQDLSEFGSQGFILHNANGGAGCDNVLSEARECGENGPIEGGGASRLKAAGPAAQARRTAARARTGAPAASAQDSTAKAGLSGRQEARNWIGAVAACCRVGQVGWQLVCAGKRKRSSEPGSSESDWGSGSVLPGGSGALIQTKPSGMGLLKVATLRLPLWFYSIEAMNQKLKLVSYVWRILQLKAEAENSIN